MTSSYLSSNREYYEYYGLTPDKLDHAKSDALIMHPGPMNRGIEIDTRLAAVSYTHLRAHETLRYLVCRLLLEKKKFKD